MPVVDQLPPLLRLTLAYAPAAAREAWLTALALDVRLAGVVRAAKEPVLAQLKLAWWRDRLAQEPAERPQGEPLLGRLAEWHQGGASLAPLVDGWEALLAEPPLPADAITAFATGRAALIGDLAQMLGADRADAESRARRWSLAELELIGAFNQQQNSRHPRASGDPSPDRRLPSNGSWKTQDRELGPRLRGDDEEGKGARSTSKSEKVMRPLIMLEQLSLRACRRGAGAALSSPVDLLVAVRLGLLGR